MNKFLKFIKYILILTLFVLITLFCLKAFKSVKDLDANLSYRVICICILYLIYFIFNLYDLIKNNEKKYDSKYQIFNIIGLITISFIFVRALFDPMFLANTKGLDTYYHSLLFQYNISYVEVSSLFISIIILLMILYRIVNKKALHN